MNTNPGLNQMILLYHPPFLGLGLPEFEYLRPPTLCILHILCVDAEQRTYQLAYLLISKET